MEKSVLIEESIITENLPDQIEGEALEVMQGDSPDRQLTDAKNTSPNMKESHNVGHHHRSIDGNADSEDRQVGREITIENIQENRKILHPEVTTPAILESESSFACKYPGCNFSSVDAELYLKHEDTHDNIGDHSCDVCGTTFKTYAMMRRHHLYVHQGIRTFECQYCSKRFLRKEQLSEHLSKHSKPRPYQCTFCGETFSFRGHLKTHLSTEHTGIVVGRTCHLCNFKASSPNAIKVHYATFHLKQNADLSADSERNRDLCVNAHIQGNHLENGAIDLATVSQNFSYMASHYSPYVVSNGDSNIMIAGPSDLSCRRSKVIQQISTPITNVRSIEVNASEQTTAPLKGDDNRHTSVTSLAGSTVVSPPTCQDSSCQRIEMRAQQKTYIKPEPPELIVDDSQSSNVQPTSTMDLSTNEVVETTCTSHDASGSLDTPCRRKHHKHSSSDDTGSESHNSPSTRLCSDAQVSPRIAHTCYRYRPYDESNSQRCREYSRHTCVSHRHGCERRTRLSDSDIDRTMQNEQSDNEERKFFFSRATSTNNPMVPLTENRIPRSSLATSYSGETPVFTTSNVGTSELFARKTISMRDIERCTLNCAFCGIIFPDQTLYLLHRSLHSESNPWKCNLCGKLCEDKYDFNSHVISKGHH